MFGYSSQRLVGGLISMDLVVTIYFPAPPYVFLAFLQLTAVMILVWVIKFLIRLVASGMSA